MAKQLKITIKNEQIAKKINLDNLKEKLKKKQEPAPSEPLPKNEELAPPQEKEEEEALPKRIRAKTKSDFVQPTSEKEELVAEAEEKVLTAPVENAPPQQPPIKEKINPFKHNKLGPTGKHISDLLAPAKKKVPETPLDKKTELEKEKKTSEPEKKIESEGDKKPVKELDKSSDEAEKKKDKSFQREDARGPVKQKKPRDFRDVKPTRLGMKPHQTKDRRELEATGEEEVWRKRKSRKEMTQVEEEILRPQSLAIRLPITVKDLAVQMKRKSSELIQKLFMQGVVVTLNDFLEDETTVQFLGEELGCTISIDTTEQKRIQVIPQTVREEIAKSDSSKLKIRPPVVTFMGHVDHGKTSLIDAIRESNRVAGEAGAITQHIGAFLCHTRVGDLTVLDTPGHEAFSAMRARGASTTDIVVLVVAGDEGIKEQTLEAIQQALTAKVTIVVAINKCDKPNFNAENIYRQLAEVQLLPEAWGGTVITVNTSAMTKQGVPELLEMLALQAEVLELKADENTRARGIVLESELHKGMGNVATILVQNGTLRQGDALVFVRHYGKVKTIHNDLGQLVKEAGPSTPVQITGLSGTPAAGDSFVVVASEKEAKSIISARTEESKQLALRLKKPVSLDKLMESGQVEKKVLKLILRADVQGSLEALKSSILRITSNKATCEIVYSGIGEVSESDVQLAQASHAVIIGFHSVIESHAESLIKEYGVTVKLFDVIYHAIDEVKNMMLALLDKIAIEVSKGEAAVLATFKSSQLGIIAGCVCSDGTIHRNHMVRVVRDSAVIWQGKLSSIRRGKEDVKEVKKGIECGLVLDGFNDIKIGDQIKAFEISYQEQEL